MLRGRGRFKLTHASRIVETVHTRPWNLCRNPRLKPRASSYSDKQLAPEQGHTGRLPTVIFNVSDYKDGGSWAKTSPIRALAHCRRSDASRRDEHRLRQHRAPGTYMFRTAFAGATNALRQQDLVVTARRVNVARQLAVQRPWSSFNTGRRECFRARGAPEVQAGVSAECRRARTPSARIGPATRTAPAGPCHSRGTWLKR